jgi:hypothetical protein
MKLGGRLGDVAGALLIPLLMFADDIVLIAESAADLQRLLDILSDFCSKHQMVVNFSKTKVVIYHATYQTAKDRKHIFCFAGRPLEVATQYKYLGLLTPARNTTEHMASAVADRGTAAKAALFKRYAHLGIEANAVLKRKLFDAIVVPNLTFGCEVWGPWLLQHDFKDKAFDNEVEAVRLSFYRSLLQLKSSTPHWVIYREMGEYPFCLRIARQWIRFCRKLLFDFESTPWARLALQVVFMNSSSSSLLSCRSS